MKYSVKNSEEKYKSQIKRLEVKNSELKFELEDAHVMLEEERKKHRFYQLIADFAFGWELWFEPGGKIQYCSPSCYDMTGFTSNQIVSTESLAELMVYEPDVTKFKNFLADSIDQMMVTRSLEFRILTRTKQLRWCLMNIRGVYDKFGKYLGVRASIQDVTRLKKAMGNIKELEIGKQYQHRTKERLQNELELKDRELVAFLLQLSQKNELLTGILKLIKNLDLKNVGKAKKQIDQIIELLGEKPSQLLDWTVVENQIEKIHPGFFYRLSTRHPNISVKDKKLSAYLRLGLTSKEISGLQNITPKSVEISRIRLRKKLKLNRAIRLSGYLAEI